LKIHGKEKFQYQVLLSYKKDGYRYGQPNNPLKSKIFKNLKIKAKITVNNKEEIKTINNILLTIKGSMEEDRVVIAGSHYDSGIFQN
jgi:hypothetical protein